MISIKVKKTGLLFGEGKNELTFFNFLLKTDKFRSLEQHWFIDTDHASGSSCHNVLEACIKRATNERIYDTILCFIDTDKLYHDYPKIHAQKREELELRASEHSIEIIWQETNHEEELGRGTNGKISNKAGMKRRLKANKDKLLRSEFVKSIYRRFYEQI